MSVSIAKGGPSGSDQGGGGQRAGLLSVNDLTYLLEPDLSVAVNVTYKNHYFQSGKYNNSQRMICILNSGADYIDTRSSYLKFDIKLDPQGDIQNQHKNFCATGPCGSIMNIFRSVTISTRSGVELSRVEDVNRLNAMMNGYRFCSKWHKTTGESIGMNQSLRVDKTHTFCIPLYLLSDLFGYGRLMPSMLMSGLRVEFEFAQPNIAFVWRNLQHDELTPWNENTVVPQLAWTVDNPYFGLKCVQLTDATQRALNQLSSQNGLEIVYTDFEKSSQNFSQAENGHVEVQKSCSRALKAFARLRQLNRDTNPSVDSFSSPIRNPIVEYQWSLGSLYFPQQPVKGTIRGVTSGTVVIPTNSINNEAYLMLLDSMNKQNPKADKPHIGLRRCTAASDNTMKQFKTGKAIAPLFVNGSVEWSQVTHYNDYGVHQYLTTPNAKNLLTAGASFSPDGEIGSFSACNTTIGVSLERSSLFGLSGVPINNSRILKLALKWQNGVDDDTVANEPFIETNNGHVVDVYLKYVRLARVFLNNCEVEQ